MKDTKFAKSVCKIIFGATIIASLIAGLVLLAQGQVVIGLSFLIGGSLASIISILMILVICEISKNIYYIRKSVSDDSIEEDDEEENDKNNNEDTGDGITDFGNGIRL